MPIPVKSAQRTLGLTEGVPYFCSSVHTDGNMGLNPNSLCGPKQLVHSCVTAVLTPTACNSVSPILAYEGGTQGDLCSSCSEKQNQAGICVKVGKSPSFSQVKPTPRQRRRRTLSPFSQGICPGSKRLFLIQTHTDEGC